MLGKEQSPPRAGFAVSKEVVKMAYTPWAHSRSRRDFSISVRYLEASGAVKNVTKTITSTLYSSGSTNSSPYIMRWDISIATQDPSKAYPDADSAKSIAEAIAKIYGSSAVPTQMSFGGQEIMRSDGT